MLVMAKSDALYRSRIGNSIALLILGVAFGLIYHFAGQRGIASTVQSVSGIFLVICLFAGVQLTADAIAQEKREGTLGLLLLTPLTHFQIVMGKLVANSLSGFYWLLIAAPLLSLTMIVGGIRGRDMLLLIGTGLNTLFVSAAAGLFASTRHTERKKAANLGSWIMLFFWLGVPGLVFLSEKYLPLWVGEWLGLFTINGSSIFYTGPRAFRTFTGLPAASLLAMHLVGWFLVGLATWSLRRNWQDIPARKRRTFREWWKNLSLGKPPVRLRLRRKLVDVNPFFWLASRDRLRVLSVWIVTLILALVIGASALLTLSGIVMATFSLIAMFSVALCMFHRGSAAGMSAHQLQLEHEQGTLEMLISTPLSTEQIIKGQLKANIRHYRGPVTIVLLLHLMAIGLLHYTDTRPGETEFTAAMAIIAHSIIYLLDLFTLGWVGMWCLTSVREARNAGGAAVVRVFVVPILFVVAIMSVRSAMDKYLNWPFEPTFGKTLSLWFTIAVANNLFWIFYVRRKLPDRLRVFAMKRYNADEHLSFFARLIRSIRRRMVASKMKGKIHPTADSA